MQKKYFAPFVFLIFAISAFAQGTRTWDQSKFDDFEKGTPRGVAISSDGYLSLAPAFRALATTPSTYLWAVASDPQGNIFAAAGAPSRVYRITPAGKVTVVLAPEELQVQALAVAPDGTVYAATSPDGRVYRIIHEPSSNPAQAAQPVGERQQVTLDPGYTSSVFFDPRTKYIWDLALDKNGALYVATGDRGEIYRVNRDGTSSLFFKSDEAHIRTIAFDPQGNLIAGSDGSGLIYRITPAGEGFVLYSAPKKEITALAIDPQGNIYAAGAGDKRAGTPGAPQPVIVPQPQPAGAPPNPQAPQMAIPQVPIPGLGATGSEIYLISADGSPKRLWGSRDDLVYALAFDLNGQLLAGTGNKGKIYAINKDGSFSDLLKASANQIVGFAHAPQGGLYAATSNLGKIFLLQATPQPDGEYESDVFDAHIFSRWGRAEVRSRGNIELFARSGNVDNPDRNWSTWKKVDLQKEAALDIPSARYMQWKAVLHAGKPAPQLDNVLVNYLPKNVAPEVNDIAVTVGSRFQMNPRTVAEMGSSAPLPLPNQQNGGNLPLLPDAGSVAISWRAQDENDDRLSYSIYYKGDNETRWKLLKSNLGDRFYTIQSGLLPDGGYNLRVVASDAPSHAPDDAMTASKESARFEVDNTPPVVSNLAATADLDGLHLTFTAADSYSPIQRAEFSIDAGDWQYVTPVGGISDAKLENYDVTVPLQRLTTDISNEATGGKNKKQASPQMPGGSEEHTIVVRAYDRFGNMGSAKVIVHPKP